MRRHRQPAVDTPEFRHRVQQSEIRRTWMMLGVLGAVLLLVVARAAAHGVVMHGVTLSATLVVLLGAAAFEGWLLWTVRRAEARQALVSHRLELLATVVEACIPTAAILTVQWTSPLGVVHGATPPAVLAYGVVLCLSILRLRPWLCLVAGMVGAAGNVVAVVTALVAADDEGEPLYTAVMLSYPAMILLTGAVAAVVTRQVAEWVNQALEDAQERQRMALVARHTLIFGLAKLAEYRDSDTGTHLDRISAYSQILASELRPALPEIDDDWIERLLLASAMHDIGKVGVPDAVLCKPGRLTDDERKVIQTHPGLGSDALQAILQLSGSDALLEMSADIASCHHERWDGKGYPAGLEGERIPLAARIVSVADVYDALTSARVYKPAMPHAEAARLIREGSGTQFDPQVVAAFERAASLFELTRGRLSPAVEAGAAAGPGTGTEAGTAPASSA